MTLNLAQQAVGALVLMAYFGIVPAMLFKWVAGKKRLQISIKEIATYLGFNVAWFIGLILLCSLMFYLFRN